MFSIQSCNTALEGTAKYRVAKKQENCARVVTAACYMYKPKITIKIIKCEIS